MLVLSHLGFLFHVRGESRIDACKLVHKLGLLKVHVNLIGDLVDLLLGLSLALLFILLRDLLVVILYASEEFVDTAHCVCNDACKSWVVRSSDTTSGTKILLSGLFHLLLLESLLSFISGLLLFNNLFDVQVVELVFNLSLLCGKFGLHGFLSLAKAFIKRIILLLFVEVGLSHQLIIVAVTVLHEIHELVAHLSLVLCTHSELITDRLLLGLNLVFLLLLESVKTFLFKLLVLFFSGLDTLTLLGVVWILKNFVEFLLKVVLVLLDEIFLLFIELAIDSLLSIFGLFFDLLSELLLLQLSAALKTLLQNSV